MKSLRLLSRSTRSSRVPHCPGKASIRLCTPIQTSLTRRPFSTTYYRAKGILPDSEDPAPPKTESTATSYKHASPAEISEDEFHEVADQYLNNLVLAVEERAENSEGLEVEYAAGVLTITHPKGTYVVNKQPPNKQVWLSSPISGPKRYDWVLTGAGQHEKEGSEYGAGDDNEGGKWVYLRDGSTLTEVLSDEIQVDVTPALGDSDAIGGREGPGGGGQGAKAPS